MTQNTIDQQLIELSDINSGNCKQFSNALQGSNCINFRQLMTIFVTFASKGRLKEAGKEAQRRYSILLCIKKAA